MNTNVFENVKKVRILYCCVFSDKEIAKSEGFHWEPEQKRWYDEFSLGTNEENGIKECKKKSEIKKCRNKYKF